MRWEELTGDRFAAAVEECEGVCLIALSVVERHGHHLPLGTDMYEGRGILERVAAQEKVILFPDYIFTQIPEARHLAGTISIDGDLMIQLLDNVCREIARNGLPQAATQDAGEGAEDKGKPPAASRRANGKDAPAARTAPRRSEAFVGIDDATMKQLVRDAVEAGRVEIHLQPIVSLPQRKVRYYEALARLRTDAGDLMQPDDFLPFARMQDLMPAIDFTVLVRAVQVVRRLTAKNREVGVFLNVSLSTLQDERFANRYVEFAEHNKALASAIIFEFSQREYATVGPLEQVGFDQLAELGFRFSVDAVERLSLDGRTMSERRVRFVKVDAELLLQANGGMASDIHPADLSDLLARYGIDLIATRIERESEVVDLIDYDVRFAQGNLFSPPRPVKADILQDGPAASLEAAQ